MVNYHYHCSTFFTEQNEDFHFELVRYQLDLVFQLFNDGVPCHIETSPLIYRANQWTGFYIIGTSVMKSGRVQKPVKSLCELLCENS